MKQYGILVGMLLVLALVMPAAAPALPTLNVDANWTGALVDGGTTNWQAAGTGTGGLAHVVAQANGELTLIYREETATGIFSAPVEIANRSGEPGTTLGYGPAVALSGTDEVYASYFISTTTALQVGLATNEGGIWTNETVATFPGLAYTPGDRTAITLDGAGAVHIVFTNSVGEKNLTHAWYDDLTSSWKNETIIGNAGPASSIALTPGGGLLVSYIDLSTPSLKVTEYDGSNWGAADDVYGIVPGESAITENAIAIGSDTYPRVLFSVVRSDGVGGDRLYLADKTAIGWGTPVIVDEDDSAPTYFTAVDIAMDGNTVHGVYASTVPVLPNFNSSLQYLTDSSGTLETSNVAGATSDIGNLFTSPCISYPGSMPVIGTAFADNAAYLLRPVFNPTFTATPSSGEAPLTVTVTANSPLVTPTSVSWDFGNGDTGTGMTDTTVYDTSGTYTITMTATFGMTEVNKEQTVTVTAPSVGDDSSLPEPEIQRVSSTATADRNTTRATFNFTSEPVKGIEILGYVVPEDTTASVLSLIGQPDDAVPSGQVWQYLEMSLAGITKKDVLGAYISFRIPEQVILSSGYTTEDVALVHLTGDGWERLPTILEKKEGAYVYYRAYTPGFSYFAIIFDEKATIRDLPELEQVIEENVSGNDEQTPGPEATPTGGDANVTPTPEITPTEPTATPIASVTVPVPETTPTQSPAPLAALIAGLAACAVWSVWRRE